MPGAPQAHSIWSVPREGEEEIVGEPDVQYSTAAAARHAPSWLSSWSRECLLSQGTAVKMTAIVLQDAGTPETARLSLETAWFLTRPFPLCPRPEVYSGHNRRYHTCTPTPQRLSLLDNHWGWELNREPPRGLHVTEMYASRSPRRIRRHVLTISAVWSLVGKPRGRLVFSACRAFRVKR